MKPERSIPFPPPNFPQPPQASSGVDLLFPPSDPSLRSSQMQMFSRTPGDIETGYQVQSDLRSHQPPSIPQSSFQQQSNPHMFHIPSQNPVKPESRRASADNPFSHVGEEFASSMGSYFGSQGPIPPMSSPVGVFSRPMEQQQPHYAHPPLRQSSYLSSSLVGPSEQPQRPLFPVGTGIDPFLPPSAPTGGFMGLSRQQHQASSSGSNMSYGYHGEGSIPASSVQSQHPQHSLSISSVKEEEEWTPMGMVRGQPPADHQRHHQYSSGSTGRHHNTTTGSSSSSLRGTHRPMHESTKTSSPSELYKEEEDSGGDGDYVLQSTSSSSPSIHNPSSKSYRASPQMELAMPALGKRSSSHRASLSRAPIDLATLQEAIASLNAAAGRASKRIKDGYSPSTEVDGETTTDLVETCYELKVLIDQAFPIKKKRSERFVWNDKSVSKLKELYVQKHLSGNTRRLDQREKESWARKLGCTVSCVQNYIYRRRDELDKEVEEEKRKRTKP
ncbi:hypothetical protein ADUPG1_008762 [Aduncisulcus paluster]|uniref:Homeobox domain-containing protein n=1 Tax=Aduncisulcus paluster TaxID=2918883 RepID=A0ABQ5KT59_9EUKA|nr:hypothetical protein ADUPG1_008762 [Aduncisulcus paluster]